MLESAAQSTPNATGFLFCFVRQRGLPHHCINHLLSNVNLATALGAKRAMGETPVTLSEHLRDQRRSSLSQHMSSYVRKERALRLFHGKHTC